MVHGLDDTQKCHSVSGSEQSCRFIWHARPTVDTFDTTWEKRNAVNYTFMLPHRPTTHTKQPNALAKAVILNYCIYPASSCLLWQTSVSLH